ncbi:lymphokine-activated killer T-cell-originated protein kinase isoform X1 [Petromyzon marinus]|uniref:lymphokine-activated killer T-cell-originated protein kinase isoform X1 n=1 Tax=Petromyzon marinus TaxID=7757 RepID=UPI003F7148BB
MEVLFQTPKKNPRVKSLHDAGKGTPAPSMEIPPSPFMKKLGYGTGVNVYLLKRSPRGVSRSPWAVKKINSLCRSGIIQEYQKRLKEEAKLLQNLSHPNIVGYRAMAQTNDGGLALVMEYGGEKSLFDIIEERLDNDLGPFPASIILKTALEIAKGLQQLLVLRLSRRQGDPGPVKTIVTGGGRERESNSDRLYLHKEKMLLHADIKSANIVIMEDFQQIKLCDVGYAMALDENMKLKNKEDTYVGTEPWKPKEALIGGVITDRADIFAYGLTLWEMMSLQIPHVVILDEDSEEEYNENSFDDEEYYAALGSRPALNMEELDESYARVIDLFVACTDEDPQKRPSAENIVRMLQEELS